MTEIFLYIVNMSITASVLAVIVLLLRLLLKKAPKWISVLLWGLVAIRLICPFAVESSFSLMPKTDWVVQEPLTEEDLFLNSVPDTIPAFDSSSFGSDVTVHYYPIENPNIEIHRGISISFILSCAWAAGMVALLLHTVISTIRLHRSIGTAIRIQDNVWESSAVESPFVLGMIRPRIYVPRGMTEEKLAYVIAHEQSHIRRKDHWWKPLGFIVLTVHWFNPVMWLAYILLCRDIEMACDERVVKEYDDVQRADYSEALLDCSVKRSMIAACPLAFGEVGVNQRIKSVLNYKKPAFWIVVLAVIACVVTAVCFLTNPLTVRNPWVQEYVVGAEGILGQVDKAKYESISEDFSIGADKYGRAVFKDPFTAFDTMKELYSEGLILIAEEQDLSPISHRSYNLYKKFGWQVTAGSEEAQKQARFVTNFLDIYENSFDKEKPNTDLPDPTVEGETGIETIIAPNISEEKLTYEILKQHQEEIWVYRNSAVNDTLDETFRKWGERIAAVGVNDVRNCVDVYVYDFDEGDIGRFKKALGHLSYVLIQKDDVIEMIPDEKKQLTLEDVIELSAKGQDLIWEDFEAFKSIVTGSGLYIRMYEIDENFSLFIGGGSPLSTPMYIRLKCNDVNISADVTTDDIAAFIEKHTKEGPILYDRPLSYYINLAWEEAEPIANAKGYIVQKSDMTVTHDNHGNITVIFNGSDRNGGWSEIHVTLVPQSDGGYGVDSTLTTATSHSELMEEQELAIEDAIREQKDNMSAIAEAHDKAKILNLFTEIESSPSYSSNPKDYIDAHPDEYSKLIEYGNHTLIYIFNEFLAGGQTGLHGHVMCMVMMNLLNENEIIAYDAVTGQDYFDQWLASARTVQKQHDPVWLEVNVPAIALVLSMLEE